MASATTSSFSSLTLSKALLGNLDSLGYKTMTPIQAQSLPPILAGQDVIGQGKTGSGKTAAFGLGSLNKLQVEKNAVQTLVLCPTRELADQVTAELRRLARGLANVRVLPLCGGVPSRIQAASLERGAHVVVGTPGRVEDHLRNKRLDLQNLTTLVLDEADRMLEMGFEPQINAILEYVPSKRQTLLFSATFPTAIQATAKRVMIEPVMIKVDSTHDENTIEQHFYPVASEAERLIAVKLLLLQHQPTTAVVFCNTKKATQQVTGMLLQNRFSAAMLNGDMEQRDRDVTLTRFANGSVCTLVATDVAARGLDIDSLDAVINFDVAHDAEIHTHRVGRTGRAGGSGMAYTLYSQHEEYKISEISSSALERSEALPDKSVLAEKPPEPNMVTLEINSGKKQKIRPGDILGALTGQNGIPGDAVGKIQITPIRSYVAVKNTVASTASGILNDGKLKGRTCRARIVRG